MADVYVGSHVEWGQVFKSFPDRPSFAAYVERLRARPAYQEAKAIDNKLIAEMQANG
jgi:glutathione S-transferase